MTKLSTRLTVTPVGRAVAQSALHPASANQLIDYAAQHCADLLHLADDSASEDLLRFSLLHAAYSSDEYSIRGNGRNLPYQLDHLINNTIADQSDSYLIESPWRRNPIAANAALVGIRWAAGKPRNELASDFQSIGSGVIQGMIREGTEILFAWSDCLAASTASYVADEDRPEAVRNDPKLLIALRNLVSTIRNQARTLAAGVPGEAAWMNGLTIGSPGRRPLSRQAIVALHERKLSDPVELLRHGSFRQIIEVLTELTVPDPRTVAEDLRSAVRKYRQDWRSTLWEIALDRAPTSVKVIIRGAMEARGKKFEQQVEAMLDAVGIAYQRLDDGSTAGAPDFRIGLNHKVQIIAELKTAEGGGSVGLNEATDVIKGAAIAEVGHLPKLTLANPGFDPNVPWQARNVKDLALIEACQFGYGISLLAVGDITKETFLDWLAQPGLASVGQLRRWQAETDY